MTKLPGKADKICLGWSWLWLTVVVLLAVERIENEAKTVRGGGWTNQMVTRGTGVCQSEDLYVVIPIPPGIDERFFNAESDLLESLLNHDSPIDSTKIDSIFDEFSLPRPLEESNSEYSDATIESLSPSPILIEDSDSLMEEIDLFLASDDSMPPGIEIDYYDSEGYSFS
ncbi:hypothetical protein Tco_1300470 [Tanacetum coccineum]